MVLLFTFQRVQDDYRSAGWAKHHTQMLEYEDSHAEDAKPFITFEVAEPADDMEKNWKVTIISAVRVSFTFSQYFFLPSSLLHGFVSFYVI